MKEKKAVSPIISTVLLIMVVIIIAIIIFLWAKTFMVEVVEKDIAGNKKTAEQFCLEVKLNPLLQNDKKYGFENIGSIPLGGYLIKVSDKVTGESSIWEYTNKDEDYVNPGSNVIISNHGDYTDYEEIKVIPVILGTSEDGGIVSFTCPESSALIIYSE